MRFGYPAKLATSVRGRLKRLQTGANPAELQLGHDCSVEQCTALLGHLDAHWYQLPRRADRRARWPRSSSARAVCRPRISASAAARSSARIRRARLSFEEAQQLQALGPITDYDRGREDAEREWAWERWQGAYEWREASLHARVRRAPSLVAGAARASRGATADLRVGCVTRVAHGAATELALSLRLWSGSPKAISLLPLSAAGSEDAPLPALILAETPDDKACLVLPPRTFNPSRVLRSLDAGAERRFRLTRLLQRGADFERAAFEETA